MAFQSAAGHGNLPNGNFSPIIFSKEAQIAFRRSSVVQAITNNDYFGEISEFGDTVRIIKEPQLAVSPYSRGTRIAAQDLIDEEIVLVIDQANYFAFKVDDIEEKHAHHNWSSMATDQAGYRLRDAMDSEVLTYMAGQATAALTIGTTSTPTQIRPTGGNFTPLGLVARIKRLLDENNVPQEGRWFAADPVYYELLSDEDSKLLNADFTEKGILRNGRVSEGTVRGFDIHESNNLLTGGTGPTATSGANFGVILAGHMSSTASAEQINKTESYRDTESFGDIVRGLHLFGRKTLRDDALVRVNYQS